MLSFLFSTLIIFALVLAGQSQAKQIYSWTDANGTKHYSDQPPPTSVPKAAVQQRLVDVDPKPAVRLREVTEEGAVEYRAYNELAGPVSVSVQLRTNGSFLTDPPDVSLIELPPQREVPLMRVAAVGAGGEFQFRYSWTPGSPAAQPDPHAVYLMPFADGLSFQIHQAFGGEFSHSGVENYYAVDIAMPTGTPVTAARAGVVMQVEKDFYRAGTKDLRQAERANYVMILHADGTMATYAHLDLEKVFVGVGKRVDAGDVIARSGNTGFSTGPHLHFVVQRNLQGRLQSVPFVFTHQGARQVPKLGDWLGNKL